MTGRTEKKTRKTWVRTVRVSGEIENAHLSRRYRLSQHSPLKFWCWQQIIGFCIKMSVRRSVSRWWVHTTRFSRSSESDILNLKSKSLRCRRELQASVEV